MHTVYVCKFGMHNTDKREEKHLQFDDALTGPPSVKPDNWHQPCHLIMAKKYGAAKDLAWSAADVLCVASESGSIQVRVLARLLAWCHVHQAILKLNLDVRMCCSHLWHGGVDHIHEAMQSSLL